MGSRQGREVITPRVRKLVLERAEGLCERCGKKLDSFLYSLQHRRARGMGGSRRTNTNTPTNLGALCGSATTGCHGFVESHPRLAADEGWRVPQRKDPADVPVLSWRGWVYLDDEGGYVHLGATA
jgi:hypothetical protein